MAYIDIVPFLGQFSLIFYIKIPISRFGQLWVREKFHIKTNAIDLKTSLIVRYISPVHSISFRASFISNLQDKWAH